MRTNEFSAIQVVKVPISNMTPGRPYVFTSVYEISTVCQHAVYAVDNLTDYEVGSRPTATEHNRKYLEQFFVAQGMSYTRYRIQ